uniref:Probable RNA polymerase II nuclear localization protein SLC7A6OS n=1 Tax=Mycena chlorophos TaxID=658473 RepID=A0ABQ0KY12_MYCCL|nr:predicted protein [Mycena chlorophos]
MATNSFDSGLPTRGFSLGGREESFLASNAKELSNPSDDWLPEPHSSASPWSSSSPSRDARLPSLSIVVRGTAISAPRHHAYGPSAAARTDDRSCVRYTLTDPRKHRAIRVMASRDMQSYLLTEYDLKEVLDERGVVVSVRLELKSPATGSRLCHPPAFRPEFLTSSAAKRTVTAHKRLLLSTLMDVDVVPPTYTILRIKRKRGEEPLDALVVEPEPEESSRRRKKSRGGAGGKKRDIQDQVSRLAAQPGAVPNVPMGTPSPMDPAQQAVREEMQRRYKIILQEEQEQERGVKKRLPSSPPKIFSAKELAAAKAAKESGFTMYDAVLSADKPTTAAELDDEMEKFLPMLSEYLSVNDITLPTKTGTESLSSSTSSDDYVWDVFYHRPVTLSEWNAAANVATITGLPASLTDAYDSASDSEAEDEADEDSNAEEYYRNDYPDEEEDSSEESRSSDEFYDDSDDAEYVADDSDHEWR